MASIVSRLCSLFSLGTKKAPPQNDTTTNNSPPPKSTEHNTATEPTSFSLKNAEQGFYNTIFDNVREKQPLTTTQKSIIAEVGRSLKNQQKRVHSVPRLPSIIPKLLKSLRDPNASSKDFVNIINKDPALSTAVLKMANSVYFNPQENKIDSIETAVVKLGLTGLRTVLSTAVMQPVMQGKSRHLSNFSHQLWTHSLCCAAACEAIAKQRQLEPFKAYLLGLVHDIGNSTIVNQLSIQHSQSDKHGNIDYSSYAPIIQTNAKALSTTIALDWQLPEEICSALQQQVNISLGSVLTPYAHLLFQANLICEIYAVSKRDNQQLEAALAALKELSLPEDLFDRLDLVSTEL
jgi:HD-like signal output (HDOD) protein